MGGMCKSTLLAVLLSLSLHSGARGQTYSLTGLGDLPGGIDASWGYGMNNNGDACGEVSSAASYPFGFAEAHFWSGGVMTGLGNLVPGPPYHSKGQDVNTNEQVVGWSATTLGWEGFIWDQVNGMVGIGYIGGCPGGEQGQTFTSYAEGINTAGLVAGGSSTTSDCLEAIVWQGGTFIHQLGFLSGDVSSTGLDINDAVPYQVVGDSYDAVTSKRTPYIWDQVNGMVALGLLTGFDEASGMALNDSGDVAGVDYDNLINFTQEATVWLTANAMAPQGLGFLGGDDFSQAWDINNKIQVVGTSGHSSAKAFIWDSCNGMRDLNLLVDGSGTGWTLWYARAINQSGQIVGFGRNPSGEIEGFILTPITGACCDSSSPPMCWITTEDECTCIGGTYQGDGTTCNPDPCGGPPHGACCYEGADGNPACAETTQMECVTIFAGTYLGDGTTCNPDPCTGCEVDATGLGCTQACGSGGPGSQDCVPLEILVDNAGNFLEISCCDCAPTECQIHLDPLSQEISCINPCDDPTSICELMAAGHVDGTITYSCECVDTALPQECDPVLECDPCDPSAPCEPVCKGPCPDVDEVCLPSVIAESSFGAGDFWIHDCDCGTPDPHECRPVVWGGTVYCVEKCLTGMPCPPPKIVKSPPPDNTLYYTCDPCDPIDLTGACCLPTDPPLCIVTTQDDCENVQGGTYQGDGTDCVPDPCVPVLGACCLPDGSCVQTHPADCDGLEGTFMGFGVDCSQVECLGACCEPDGTCTEPVSEVFCEAALAGIFQGLGSTCNPDPCQDPPACEPDADGLACIGQCADDTQICKPIEILAAADGSFIEITCCDCDVEGCHVNYEPASGQIFCDQQCPSPDQVCTLVGKGNADGTITYVCECLDPQEPTVCEPITECAGPCEPGVCVQRCKGPCPNTDEVCMPQSFEGPSGGGGPYVILDCDCFPPGSNPCHPIIDAAGDIVCVGDCPVAGVLCSLNIGGGHGGNWTYDCCPSQEPIGACCYEIVGAGYFCTQTTLTDCINVYQGTYMGDGVPCTPTPCPVGACCTEDAAGNSICVITTQVECESFPVHTYFGDGTTCDPNPCPDDVECDCQGMCGDMRPDYTDSVYSTFTGEVAVATQFSEIGTDPVVVNVDISNRAGAPLNANWNAATLYSDPSWSRDNLGTVFGLALDSDGNTYVTASTTYILNFAGPGGWGGIYQINAVTGAISTFASLPNTLPGLGNIAYDADNDQFFVTNFSDGRIYRLDSAGNCLSTFDHDTQTIDTTAGCPIDPNDPDTSTFVALCERVWGVQVYDGRLYYSLWCEDAGQSNQSPILSNEIWSISLAGGAGDDFTGISQLEVQLPPLPGQIYSMPVSDISFSRTGCMLLGERGMYSDMQPSPHQARTLEYRQVGTSWLPSPYIYNISDPVFNGQGSAGGVDFDRDGHVWATADAIKLSPGIYGLQSLPCTGGDITNSVMRDLNDIFTLSDKTDIGDVEIPCFENCTSPPRRMRAWWPLDETAPSTAQDIARANDGAWNGGPTPVAGMVDGALSFDGMDDFVQVPDHPSLDFNKKDFSIDAWIKTTHGTGLAQIVEKRSATPLRGYSFFLYNGELGFQLADSVGYVNYVAPGGVADGMWHHVAVTVDRDDPAGLKLYVDGVATSYNPTGHPNSVSNNADLYIGARNPAFGAVYFNGVLDEIELFRRALPEAKVRALYEARSSGKCKERCSLPASTPFCWNDQTKTVNLVICNDSGVSHNYSWFAYGTGGCDIPGPTVFAPPGGAVTVPAGSCVTIPIVIDRPAGLVPPLDSCYRVTVINLDTLHRFSCKGTVRGIYQWCLIVKEPVYPSIPVLVGGVRPISFHVTNVDAPSELFEYELEVASGCCGDDRQTVSLDGLPPGEPVTGSVSVPPGETGVVTVDVSMTEHDPFGFQELVLKSDLGGGRGLDPIVSATFSSLLPACPDPVTLEGVGGRYLRATPAPSDASVALIVTSDQLPCLSKYVTAAGLLSDTLVEQTPEEWGTMFIGDSAIVPETEYQIASENACGESEVVSASTWAWGDANDDTIVNLDDILCVADGFRRVFVLCTRQAVDLMTCQPDNVIDIDDILGVLDAFGHVPYPCLDPCP